MSRRPSRAAVIAIAAAVRLLPDARRDRYREEWLADLAGADSAGVSRAQVIAGALRSAAVVPRTPETFGVSARGLARRRLRWASAFVVAASVMMLGAFLVLPALGEGLGRVAGAVLVALIAACASAGTCWAAFAVHGALAGRRPGLRWASTIGVVVAVPLAVASAMAMLLPMSIIGFIGGPVVAALAVGLPIGAEAGLRRTTPGLPARFGTRATASVGAAAVFSAAVVGVAHVLVVNPMAKLPGLSLDEIYRQMAARGESPLGAAAPVVVWGLGWVLLALVFLATALVGDRGLLRNLDARRIARATLVALACIGFTQWIAGFGMGMSIADVFFTDGTAASSIGSVLVVVGTTAGVIAALRALPPGSGTVPAPRARA
ncbi:hypothetical protein [Agromyces sp. NPDC055658]